MSEKGDLMLPTIKEAKSELEIAEKLNPGPWIEHSLNVGIAARNIAKKVPGMDETSALLSFLRTAATIDSYVIAAISMYLLSVFYHYSTIVLHIQ